MPTSDPHETRTFEDAAASTAGDGSEAVLALLVVAHPDRRVLHGRCVLDGVVELGRASAVFGEGALALPAISRHHAAVEMASSGVRVRDLGSRNGIRKNGMAVTEAVLSPGDVVQLGPVVLLLGRILRATAPRLTGSMIHAGAPMAALDMRLSVLAPTDTTVLVQGESGSGKDVVARRIHELSRRSGAFVALNCAALSDALTASELFGHAEGAFTGARRARPGLVAAAEGGTLFLDEIGDAPPALQAALLRLLELREYRPVGSDTVLHASARFVTATHKPLRAAVDAGRFREDLYNRVARSIVDVPRLADRREDIVPLAYSMLARRAGASASLGPELTVALLGHAWRGNVRELDAFIEEAALHVRADEPLGLSPPLRARLGSDDGARASERSSVAPAGAGGSAAEAPVEKRPDAAALEAMLASARGNVRGLAGEIGVGRATLYRWLKELGIDPLAVRRRARRTSTTGGGGSGQER